ncbi:hypothetical protein ACWD6P_31910, partial [Streptomyces sp. NPDC002446]
MPEFGPRRDYVPTRNSAKVVITPKGANKPPPTGNRKQIRTGNGTKADLIESERPKSESRT